SAVFAVTLVFAAVVMFDAQSFRRAAGLQARVLNQMVEELFKEHHLSQQKLVEFLGHTRTEVFSGMALG
ncbi:MAG: divergent PAP2 family protein, partial [Akkermansiaceae bacterium]|nr:divergent PAP2 family protein [Akkermansiaceae bacterium]